MWEMPQCQSPINAHLHKVFQSKVSCMSSACCTNTPRWRPYQTACSWSFKAGSDLRRWIKSWTILTLSSSPGSPLLSWRWYNLVLMLVLPSRSCEESFDNSIVSTKYCSVMNSSQFLPLWMPDWSVKTCWHQSIWSIVNRAVGSTIMWYLLLFCWAGAGLEWVSEEESLETELRRELWWCAQSVKVYECVWGCVVSRCWRAFKVMS